MMKTYAIAHNQWETLNKKGEHKPRASFDAALQQAAGGMESGSPTFRQALKPLNAAPELDALTPQDFGAAAAKKMQPLHATDHVPGAKVNNDSEDTQLRKQTAKWVAETFYSTLLKQVDSSVFKSSLFDGGRGAQAFEPMFNQQIADHIGAGTSNSLVDSVVQEIESKRKMKPTGAAPKLPANNPYWNERAHVAPGIRA